MTKITTIEITKDQKEQLDELKRAENESYKNVLQRLIDNYGAEPDELLTEAQQGQVREIALDTVNDRVLPEALE